MFHNKLEILYHAKKGGFTTVFTGRRPYSDMTCVVSIYDASPGACVGAKSGHGTWKTEQSGVSPHLHLCSIYDRRCNSNKNESLLHTTFLTSLVRNWYTDVLRKIHHLDDKYSPIPSDSHSVPLCCIWTVTRSGMVPWLWAISKKEPLTLKNTLSTHGLKENIL